MTDWTGSENQRSKRRDDCLYPGAKPTPKPQSYVVDKGTRTLIKRTGDKQWRPFVTTKDLEFDSVYRDTEKSLIFFRIGFLLCVDRSLVQETTGDTSDSET